MRLLSLVFIFAATVPLTARPAESAQAKLNDGYYLLYKVADDEKQVPLLFMAKTAPPEIGAFSKRIGKQAEETVGALDKFRDRNPSLNYDRNPLPTIEQDVRDSIKEDKQHQLLFGTKDAEFVRAFLVSQIEASTYALNLCNVLADQETSPARARSLRQQSAAWLKLRDQAFRFLRG